jgi:hypothetical protein
MVECSVSPKAMALFFLYLSHKTLSSLLGGPFWFSLEPRAIIGTHLPLSLEDYLFMDAVTFYNNGKRVW